MNKINSEVYVDISVIISMMSDEMRRKISKSFIKFIEENKDANYVSNINSKVPLNQQNLRKETKELMGVIYRDYLCSSEEREKLLQAEAEELKMLEEEKRKKYNPDEIFSKEKNVKENIEKNNINELPLEYKKENFIIRILKSIILKIRSIGREK